MRRSHWDWYGGQCDRCVTKAPLSYKGATVLHRDHCATEGTSCCRGIIVLQKDHCTTEGPLYYRGTIVLQRDHSATKGPSCYRGNILLQRDYRATEGSLYYRGTIMLQSPSWSSTKLFLQTVPSIKTISLSYETPKLSWPLLNILNVARSLLSDWCLGQKAEEQPRSRCIQVDQ